MPELPEVETVCRGLTKIFAQGNRIASVELRRADVRFPIPKSFPKNLANQVITRVTRRGKYILFETDGGTLLSHLGMTGSWRLLESEPSTTEVKELLDKHDHCVLHMQDGRHLVFRDPRRFGVLDFIKTGKTKQHKLLRHLGPEPLDADAFNGQYLFTLSRGKKTSIKAFIMDQRVVVGVGNIYASEALFRAGIRPTRLSGRVTRKQFDLLALKISQVLSEAIVAGGSSIRDFRSTAGASGEFQQRHQVYDREGKPCVNCGSLIKQKVIVGRSTYWCPKCQT